MRSNRRPKLISLYLPNGEESGWRVSKGGGRNRLPRLKPDWPEKGSKRPSSGSTGLGEFFSVFGAENESFGARVYFGTQNEVYIGPRVVFR